MALSYRILLLCLGFLAATSAWALAAPQDQARFAEARQAYQQADDSQRQQALAELQGQAMAGIDAAARFLAAQAPAGADQRQWLALSSLTGNAVSEFDLAQSYLAEGDTKRARQWLLRALQHQAAVAPKGAEQALRMGQMLEWAINRYGLRLELASAMGWYAQAAQQGHPAALYALGRASLTGAGLPKDPLAALVYLEAAASAESAEATELLRLLDTF